MVVDFGSNDIHIFFPFSLFVSVYGIALLLLFFLGFCLSDIYIFYYLKNIFLNFFFIIYLDNFILFCFTLFYFILSSSFFLSCFSPFYSEPCERQALGAPTRHQGSATEVGEPNSGHWSTRDLPAPRNIKWQKSPRDLHLNTKTQLHSTTSKLQCWTPYAKQLTRQEQNPIH